MGYVLCLWKAEITIVAHMKYKSREIANHAKRRDSTSFSQKNFKFAWQAFLGAKCIRHFTREAHFVR